MSERTNVCVVPDPVQGTTTACLRAVHKFIECYYWVHDFQINISKPLKVSAFCPDSCRSQLDPVAEHQASIPMNPKHATQHASIIGNLEQLGVAHIVPSIVLKYVLMELLLSVQ